MQRRKLKSFLKILLIVVLFACINLTNGASRKVTIFEEIFSDLVTAPQRIVVYVKNFFSKDKKLFFQDVKELKEKNDELEQRVLELEKNMLDYEALLAENEVLKSHINLEAEHPNYSTIIADVILTSSSNWSLIYTVNKGEKDGVKPNMAVICRDGLVGYVESVTSNTAKVVSVLDAGNAVSARITRTRDVAISKGSLDLAEKNQTRLTNIPVDVSLIEGDRIETSGLGGVYPKGIIIGRVKSFIRKTNPLENEAIVESLVDFDKLETVAIITNN